MQWKGTNIFEAFKGGLQIFYPRSRGRKCLPSQNISSPPPPDVIVDDTLRLTRTSPLDDVHNRSFPSVSHDTARPPGVTSKQLT